MVSVSHVVGVHGVVIAYVGYASCVAVLRNYGSWVGCVLFDCYATKVDLCATYGCYVDVWVGAGAAFPVTYEVVLGH